MIEALPHWSSLPFHVKWFVHEYKWYPQSMQKIITPTFLFWLGFTLIALLVASLFNEKLERFAFVQKFHFSLNKLKRFQFLILRVGLGIGLVLQLLTGTYLAPSFAVDHVWMYIALIAALVGLFHRNLLFISGIAFTVLYANIFVNYGVFHALDYSFYIGIIYYLIIVNTRWQSTANMILYFCTGFSLAWIAMEKFTLPSLANSLMVEYKLPTMGFTVDDFILISAFIEIGLAWAFIVGILNRFSAFLLTGIFMLTTTVFGFTEIVGHTVVHTILLVFIISGTDDYKTLFKFHQKTFMRCLFVVVNFSILLFGVMAAYIWLGQWTYNV